MLKRNVLVLAGGRGERFWPWSTAERPKQLLPLARGGRTLLAATLERAIAVTEPSRVLVLTGASLADAVRRECAPFGVRVAAEPVMRNTAAAIGAAAAWFAAEGDDPAFAVMPADHAIEDTAAFSADLERAFAIAEREALLVTFGIRPTRPETGYGYICAGDRLGEHCHRVGQFTEKPDGARAEEWLAGGRHLWNSGIFVWRCSVFRDALMALRPDLAGPLSTLGRPGDVPEFERGLARVFPELESISVDYAVLEHAPNTVVIEAAFDWDDLGSWGAWARHQPHDAGGNVTFGQAIAIDCERCIVVGEGGLATALGLADMVVVHVNGTTLSCRIEDSEQIRRVSEAARARVVS
jgi:mannose-1-phosphate guanylyltransferase